MLSSNQGKRPSGRGSEVLRIVMKGRSSKEIVRTLALPPSPVNAHLSHVLLCLGATNKTQAALTALLLDLVARSRFCGGN
jgi:DNA-binding CsgD family transcriptional regulator